MARIVIRVAHNWRVNVGFQSKSILPSWLAVAPCRHYRQPSGKKTVERVMSAINTKFK